MYRPRPRPRRMRPGGITGAGRGIALMLFEERINKKGELNFSSPFFCYELLFWRHYVNAPVAEVGEEYVLGQPAGRPYQQEFPWRVFQYAGGQSDYIE